MISHSCTPKERFPSGNKFVLSDCKLSVVFNILFSKMHHKLTFISVLPLNSSQDFGLLLKKNRSFSQLKTKNICKPINLHLYVQVHMDM